MAKGNKSVNKLTAAEKLKIIRPFVSFNYDLRHELTAHQKRKINDYFKYVEPHLRGEAGTTKIYRPRDADRKNQLRKATGVPGNLREVKAFFIPVASPEQKVSFNRRGELILKTDNVTSQFIPFNMSRLLSPNSAQYVNNLLSRNNFPRFSVLYGEYDSPTMSAEFVQEHIEELINKYSDSNAHHFTRWLFGLRGFKFRNQADLQEYQKARKKAQSKKRRR